MLIFTEPMRRPHTIFASLILLAGSLTAFSDERAPVTMTREPAAEAIRLGDGHWFIDFGNATFGNIEILDKDLKRSEKVTVALGEALAGEKRLDPKPQGTVRYQSHPLTLTPGKPASPELTWAPPGWMRSGWLEPTREMGEVMPFRYVEITGAPESFDAADITRLTWTVDFDPEASSFTSSSPELDSVWDLCKHSIRATSFLGIYVDGDRERRPYEADILINQLSHYAVDAHYATARQTLEHVMRHPTWPTEWRQQTTILAWNDFLWSGDDSFIRKNFEKLKTRAMIDRRTEDGLFIGFLDGDPKDIVDWPANERDGYDMSFVVKSAVTAFHYRSLIDLRKMADHLGRRDDSRKLAAMAEQTFATFNERLWDETNGRYLDGLDPESGRKSQHASAHASFFPLALGLVPDERVARVGAFLRSKDMACSVYGAQFLLEALYLADLEEHALGLLRSDSLRSWRNMSEKVGSTVTLEAWDPSLKPNLDWNHAWGAAPSNLITRCLMGIEPLEPGFRRFRVRPATGTLESATIKSPTPAGPIHLRISREKTKGFGAQIVVPPGTTAEFHFPEGMKPAVTPVGHAGKPRFSGTTGRRRVVELGAGNWKLGS